MEIFGEINAQMAELPWAVQLWVNWMQLIFVAAIFFAWRRRGARWTLAALVASALLAPVVFMLSGNVHLFGIVHFVAWLPLLTWLLRNEIRVPEFEPRSAYGIWLLLLCCTITVSLLFDARDIVLVALGQK